MMPKWFDGQFDSNTWEEQWLHRQKRVTPKQEKKEVKPPLEKAKSTAEKIQHRIDLLEKEIWVLRHRSYSQPDYRPQQPTPTGVTLNDPVIIGLNQRIDSLSGEVNHLKTMLNEVLSGIRNVSNSTEEFERKDIV